jgi:high-affinity Fe2+/Pb2+ permease
MIKENSSAMITYLVEEIKDGKSQKKGAKKKKTSKNQKSARTDESTTSKGRNKSKSVFFMPSPDCRHSILSLFSSFFEFYSCIKR